MSKEETIIDKLTSNPYFMELTKEEYQIMQQDEDLKSKVFDFREKLNAKKLSDGQKNYLAKRKEQTELQNEFNDLGGFVFLVYQRLSVMFDDTVLSPEDKARVLLLTTYMGYDNKIKFNNSNPILKSHLPIILRVNEKTSRNFINKIESLNIISIVDKEIILNEHLFIKGVTSSNKNIKNNDFGYTRLFVNSYQYLYENLPKSKLKYLGFVYNILGYINFHHNVIVKTNPNEKDISNIEPMTFNEMLVICGYKEDMLPAAKSRLKRAILGIKLSNDTPLFALVDTDNITKILINPHVVYASSNINTWTSTLEIIFMQNKKIKSDQNVKNV
ncbi:MAG: hypothetical protein ACRC18_06900 [Cetobacterium sp.]